jgi:hypothetical protein
MRGTPAELMVISADRHHLCIGDGHLRLEHRQLEVLLVLLRSKVAPREHQDQRVAALKLAEPAIGVGVVA